MERVADSPPPYDAIVFDCDSTLCRIEGVDELAPAGSDVRRRIEALTDEAMSGRAKLDDVYGKRLELLRPTRERIEALGQAYVDALMPGARELVADLHAAGKRVAVVSGGLRPAVLWAARAVGIDAADVFAVDLRFDEAGDYVDFERDSPLVRSGGKLEVLRSISATSGRTALIGDGVTDLEAAPALARFVAFGGVARRTAVFAAARVHCDEPDLGALRECLLSGDELERLSAGR